jgi:hypothetical protein
VSAFFLYSILHPRPQRGLKRESPGETRGKKLPSTFPPAAELLPISKLKSNSEVGERSGRIVLYPSLISLGSGIPAL